MSNRLLICAALSATFGLSFGLSVPPAHAAGLDPFSTNALLTPPPSLTLGNDGELQPCPLPPVDSLTLSDVINTTLCANPQTREVWANARAQAALLGASKSSYLPSLDASVSASRNKNSGGTLATLSTNNQRGYGASLSWLLYDFGGREANVKNARELLEAANASQDATVQALFLGAVKSYYQLQATQAALEAAGEAEKAAQESFNAAEARYKAGAATPADKLQAQTAWSQAMLNRIQAEGNVKIARGTLANQMGMQATSPLILASSQTETTETPVNQVLDSVQSLIDVALKKRPDLLAAQAQTRAAQASIDAARAYGRPSISLGISSQETRTGSLPDARSSALGVTLNIPLFSGFNTTYKIRSAEAQADARQAQSDQARLQVSLDVWNSYQSLTTVTQTLRTTVDLLASAEQSQRVALGRYKAGVGNVLDVLNAQSALASARQQRVQSLYDWNVARASLAQAMGTLDNELIDSLDQSAQETTKEVTTP